MRRCLLAFVVALLVSPAAAEARFLNTGEALRVADRAAEAGPFEATRHSRTLVRLDATKTETREWDAECPFVTDCGPCHFTETRDWSLRVWVRELRDGRYRVRDSLGFAVTVR